MCSILLLVVRERHDNRSRSVRSNRPIDRLGFGRIVRPDIPVFKRRSGGVLAGIRGLEVARERIARSSLNTSLLLAIVDKIARCCRHINLRGLRLSGTNDYIVTRLRVGKTRCNAFSEVEFISSIKELAASNDSQNIFAITRNDKSIKCACLNSSLTRCRHQCDCRISQRICRKLNRRFVSAVRDHQSSTTINY